MPKTLAAILVFEVIAVYGLLFFIAPTSATSATLQSESYAITDDSIIALTNNERSTYDIAPLRYNTELSKAASAKAQYILDNDSFSHEGEAGETFSSWIRSTGYTYTRVGENLAIHFDNPDDILEAWLDSPTHRKNLLNPLFEDIGLAVVTGEYKGKTTTVVVQLFGTEVQ